MDVVFLTLKRYFAYSAINHDLPLIAKKYM